MFASCYPLQTLLLKQKLLICSLTVLEQNLHWLLRNELLHYSLTVHKQKSLHCSETNSCGVLGLFRNKLLHGSWTDQKEVNALFMDCSGIKATTLYVGCSETRCCAVRKLFRNWSWCSIHGLFRNRSYCAVRWLFTTRSCWAVLWLFGNTSLRCWQIISLWLASLKSIKTSWVFIQDVKNGTYFPIPELLPTAPGSLSWARVFVCLEFLCLF